MPGDVVDFFKHEIAWDAPEGSGMPTALYHEKLRKIIATDLDYFEQFPNEIVRLRPSEEVEWLGMERFDGVVVEHEGDGFLVHHPVKDLSIENVNKTLREAGLPPLLAHTWTTHAWATPDE